MRSLNAVACTELVTDTDKYSAADAVYVVFTITLASGSRVVIVVTGIPVGLVLLS